MRKYSKMVDLAALASSSWNFTVLVGQAFDGYASCPPLMQVSRLHGTDCKESKGPLQPPGTERVKGEPRSNPSWHFFGNDLWFNQQRPIIRANLLQLKNSLQTSCLFQVLNQKQNHQNSRPWTKFDAWIPSLDFRVDEQILMIFMIDSRGWQSKISIVEPIKLNRNQLNWLVELIDRMIELINWTIESNHPTFTCFFGWLVSFRLTLIDLIDQFDRVRLIRLISSIEFHWLYLARMMTQGLPFFPTRVYIIFLYSHVSLQRENDFNTPMSFLYTLVSYTFPIISRPYQKVCKMRWHISILYRRLSWYVICLLTWLAAPFSGGSPGAGGGQLWQSCGHGQTYIII